MRFLFLLTFAVNINAAALPEIVCEKVEVGPGLMINVCKQKHKKSQVCVVDHIHDDGRIVCKKGKVDERQG